MIRLWSPKQCIRLKKRKTRSVSYESPRYVDNGKRTALKKRAKDISVGLVPTEHGLKLSAIRKLE